MSKDTIENIVVGTGVILIFGAVLCNVLAVLDVWRAALMTVHGVMFIWMVVAAAHSEAATAGKGGGKE